MDGILDRIGEIGIVPVVKIDGADKAAIAAKAIGLGRALAAGGIPVAEITFRTAAAPVAIRAMSAEVPELLVGAGSAHPVGHVNPSERADAVDAVRITHRLPVGRLEVCPGLGRLADVVVEVVRIDLVGQELAVGIDDSQPAVIVGYVAMAVDAAGRYTFDRLCARDDLRPQLDRGRLGGREREVLGPDRVGTGEDERALGGVGVRRRQKGRG